MYRQPDMLRFYLIVIVVHQVINLSLLILDFTIAWISMMK